MTFAADRMVGRLAKWLRALGYDTIYLRDMSEKKALGLVASGRILLTRDTGLSRRLPENTVVFLEEDRTEDQLAQLFESGVVLVDDNRLFTRCLRCNEPLRPMPREEAAGMVPEYVFLSRQSFHRCPGCGRIYWPGTHHTKMKERVLRLSAKPRSVTIDHNSNGR